MLRQITAFTSLTILLFGGSGCSHGTPALDKARAMASKVTILKAELIMGDPAEYSGHQHQQLKLTIKNGNAEPVDGLTGDIELIDQSGKLLNLPDEVLFAADPNTGVTPVPGFATKEGIIGKSFQGYNQVEGSTEINVFRIQSIRPIQAFKDPGHFDAYIEEKAAG